MSDGVPQWYKDRNFVGGRKQQCTATHQAIDNGAECIYLDGHLDADIPHTTANGFWWWP